MHESIKDIINLAISSNSEQAIIKVKEYAKNLRSEGKYNEAQYVLNLLGSKATVTSANTRNEDQELNILEEVFLEEEVYNNKNESLQKFVEIINNKEKLRNLGFLKVCIYGPPGTGKSTFVKDVAKLTNKKLLSVSASNLVSSLIGQTQKNMDLLFKDIIKNYKDCIFIIDEFDSVIGSRDETMNKEYHRMIGSFNLMLDKMLPETIIFAITNRIDMVDPATLRRFNIKIQCTDIDLDMFSKRLLKLADEKNITYKKNTPNKLVQMKKEMLNYSYIDEILVNCIMNDISVEQSMFEILNFTDNEIMTSKLLSDIDKTNILNKSYSTIRRLKNEVAKV